MAAWVVWIVQSMPTSRPWVHSFSAALSLMLSGMIPSIGSVGDAFDNALAENIIGLYKTEAIRDISPLRRGQLNRLADVEAPADDWVHWYNTSRLMHRLGRIPPVEYEADYCAHRAERPAGDR